MGMFRSGYRKNLLDNKVVIIYILIIKLFAIQNISNTKYSKNIAYDIHIDMLGSEAHE